MKRLHLIVLLGVTVATMAFVAAGLPGLADVRGWFYHPVQRGLGEAWPLALGGVLVPGLVWGGVACAKRNRWAAAVVLVTIASYAAQLLLLLGDAQGLRAAWRWQHDGHGEMSRVAHEHRGRWKKTLLDYERLATEGQLGVFAPSKPPGAIGVHMAVHGLADTLDAERRLGFLAEDAQRQRGVDDRAGTAALALLLFPLLTALALPLAFAYGRVLLGDAAAAFGGTLLFGLAPATLLIQHHLDGVLYPSLALATCALVGTGTWRRAWGWAAGGGVLLGLSLYVSFSLLPVLGLALGTLAFVALQRSRHEPRATVALAAGWHAVAFVAGVLVALWALWWLMDFQLAARLTRALSYHAHWKRGVPTWPWKGWALVEYALYVGFPMMAVFLARAMRPLVALRVRHVWAKEWFAPGLLAYFAVLTLASGTNEVARLWLFTVPFVALAAATATHDAARGGRWYAPVIWLAACQGVVTLVLKANQVW